MEEPNEQQETKTETKTENKSETKDMPIFLMRKPVKDQLRKVGMIISRPAFDKYNNLVVQLLEQAADRAYQSNRKKILTRDL